MKVFMRPLKWMVMWSAIPLLRSHEAYSWASGEDRESRLVEPWWVGQRCMVVCLQVKVLRGRGRCEFRG